MPRAPSEASAGTLQGSLWRSDSNLPPISCPSCLVCGTSSGTCSWTHPPWSLAWRRNPAPRERRPVSSARERGGAFAVSLLGLRRAFRRQAKPLSSARAGQEDARFLTGGWSFRHRFRSWVILPLAMLMPSLSTPSPPRWRAHPLQSVCQKCQQASQDDDA